MPVAAASTSEAERFSATAACSVLCATPRRFSASGPVRVVAATAASAGNLAVTPLGTEMPAAERRAFPSASSRRRAKNDHEECVDVCLSAHRQLQDNPSDKGALQQLGAQTGPVPR